MAAQRGFSVAFDDRLSESLAKFDEYVEARVWEKAFRVLADIPEEKWASMLPDRHGFGRPASAHIRETILDLPADGREAYRLYFDAKARRLLETIPTATREEDVKIARTIYDRYFITSVGDDAADRLADDYFERGQFDEAAKYWKSIFDFHPDTNLSEPRLLVKRAIALYRGGQDAEFRAVRQQLEQGFPGVRLKLGGKEVAADEYLAKLASEKRVAGKTARARSRQTPPGLAPPEGTKAAWQFKILDEKELGAIEESVRNWYGASSVRSVLPAVAVDDERLYVNWLGSCFAIELASGQTVWRGDPELKSLVSQLKGDNGRMMLASVNTEQFAVCYAPESSGSGLVLAVSATASEPGHFRLLAFDAATGNQVWNSNRGGSVLAHSSFIGTPVTDGNSVYVLSHHVEPRAENQGPVANGATATRLELRRLDLRTGTEIWSLPLGTPQFVSEGPWGQRQHLPIPAMTLSGGRLYVLTNDGALLAVDVHRRELEWFYKYDPPSNAGANRQMFFNNGNAGPAPARPPNPIVVRDGTIYFKEASSPTLYALDESGPRLKWKWQDSDFANLVGVDGGDVYLFSDELSALSRETGNALVEPVDDRLEGSGGANRQPGRSRFYTPRAV